MLHVIFTNRVKLVARKPETTNNKGQREYACLARFVQRVHTQYMHVLVEVLMSVTFSFKFFETGGSFLWILILY